MKTSGGEGRPGGLRHRAFRSLTKRGSPFTIEYRGHGASKNDPVKRREGISVNRACRYADPQNRTKRPKPSRSVEGHPNSIRLYWLIQIVLPFAMLLLTASIYGGRGIADSRLFPLIRNPTESIELLVEWQPQALQGGAETELVLLGRVAAGRHLYSVHDQGEFGPDPTRLLLESDLLEPVSELTESAPITKYDQAFEVPLRVHQNDFRLRRRFRLGNKVQPGLYPISGHLLFQLCSDRICSLPLKKAFQVELTVLKAP